MLRQRETGLVSAILYISREVESGLQAESSFKLQVKQLQVTSKAHLFGEIIDFNPTESKAAVTQQ